MQVSHTRSALSASFDEPNLIGSAGLVPMMELAAEAGLHQLAKGRLTVPTDKGANAGAKIMRPWWPACAPEPTDRRHGHPAPRGDETTLQRLLRAPRPWVRSCVRSPSGMSASSTRSPPDCWPTSPSVHRCWEAPAPDSSSMWMWTTRSSRSTAIRSRAPDTDTRACVGLNALLATASTQTAAPVILGQRLRRGAVGSPRGACRLIADALATLKRLPPGPGARVLVRADSAFYRARHRGHRVESRCRRRSDRADESGGQGRHRHHRRRRLDRHRIPRGDLRRDHRHLDLQSRGRRGVLHRVHLEEEKPNASPDAWWCAASQN